MQSELFEVVVKRNSRRSTVEVESTDRNQAMYDALRHYRELDSYKIGSSRILHNDTHYAAVGFVDRSGPKLTVDEAADLDAVLRAGGVFVKIRR